MYRILTTLSISIILISFLGCGLFTSLVGKEEWSENYALIDGATATAPEMIDGNLKTLGKTAFPAGADQAWGMSTASEAMVALPEKKSIYKVVIHSPNLKTFDLQSDKGGDDWETLREVKSSQSSPIVLRVSTITDKIRIRVKTTTDDAEVRRERRARGGWGGGARRGLDRAPAEIQEFELYGYASGEGATSAATSQGESTPEEDELDQLLSK